MNDIPRYSWFDEREGKPKQRVSIYENGDIEIQVGESSCRAQAEEWMKAARATVILP